MFLCHSKIRALQALDTSNKEKIKDLENNLEETTKIVTFNNNNIQILIRRSILTKLPKKLNDVSNKLHLNYLAFERISQKLWCLN